ncbi:MAG: CPBP family intramembrane metalloprotease [Anaerolineales bacterium]|nr:CPBP family intramembrane metalloprotease [Anaerolineales bacterium]
MRVKIGLVLTLMICAQILFVSIMSLFIDLSWNIAYLLIAPIYVVIALLIFFERKNLREFNLDRFSLLLLVFSSVFRRRLGVENEFIFLLIIGIAGLVVLVSAVLNWAQVPKTNFRWLVIGLFIGCVTLVPIAFIESFQPSRVLYDAPVSYGFFWDAMRRVIYNISFNAPIEEILFRGFLWGYLKNLNWNDNAIFWTQGALFWFSHLGAIGSPLTFFLTIPIGTYILSELTKRSGRVSPSILFHLIINSMISVFI